MYAKCSEKFLKEKNKFFIHLKKKWIREFYTIIILMKLKIIDIGIYSLLSYYKSGYVFLFENIVLSLHIKCL